MLPQAADQLANAEAVARAGAGLALGPDDVSADSVREAAERLLADPGYAARAGDDPRGDRGDARRGPVVGEL